MLNKTQTLLALTVAACGISFPATAYYSIYSPKVEYGETELELYGQYISDDDPAADGAQQYILEVAKGITPKAYLRAKLETEKVPGEDLKTEAVAVYGGYLLTEPGESSWDVVLQTEIEYSIADSKLAAVAFGPLLATEVGDNMTFTANLIAEYAIEERFTEGNVNAQLKWRLNPVFEPAIEVFTNNENRRLIGPVVMGKIKTTSAKIGYQLGWLTGMNNDTDDNTYKFEVEYEF